MNSKIGSIRFKGYATGDYIDDHKRYYNVLHSGVYTVENDALKIEFSDGLALLEINGVSFIVDASNVEVIR